MKKQSTGVKPEVIDRLATIWAIVEARITFPALIIVTGATQADEAALVARGMAEAANGAGKNVGYLELRTADRASISAGPYSALSIDPRGSPRDAFDDALARWRTMYDAVIVDAETLESGPLAAHVARIADGVVIALRDKRRVVPADRELAVLLSELEASVLGVVMTAPLATTSSVRAKRDRTLSERFAQS